MATQHAVILGALGVTGRNLLHWLEANTDWRITGVARRKPNFETRAQFVQVDLLDRDATFEALAHLKDVTHVFFCGFVPMPSWPEHDAPNLAILANGVEAIEKASPALEHVHLIEGTKIYGSHLGRFRTPAKEDDPPHMLPNFYYTQEQWLRRHRQGKDWSWSALRPQTVCGFSLGSPMNLINAIAVYAAISKEMGLPLRYPGSEAAYRAIYQVTDADLLSKCMHWCATAEGARDDVFNITNTDFFRWENVWPRFAKAFDMELGQVQHISLAQFMPDKAGLWQDIQKKYGLEPYSFEDLVSWPFADYCFTRDYDVMTDTLKIRRAGFHDCVDTEQMFIDLFDTLRAKRVIP